MYNVKLKYDLDDITSAELIDIFETAKRNPDDFIRIALTPERMVYSNQSRNIFPTLEGYSRQFRHSESVVS